MFWFQMPPSVLARLRKAALTLPESHEVEAWGTSTFRIRKGKIFAMYAASSTHAGAGRTGVWIKATQMNQQLMLGHAPDRFFFPPYVGKGGWIGVFLDGRTDWPELAELLADGWRLVAPKKVAALLDSSKPAPKPAPRRAVSRPKSRLKPGRKRSP